MHRSRPSLRCALGWVVLATTLAPAASTPEDLGFSSPRLERLDAAIQEPVDAGRLAGGIMYIARDGETAHLKTYGMMDVEAARPMPADAIFRIASMSKAITTTAVMMLYEEGRFRLHDPIEKYLPAFANRVVAIAPPPGTPPGTPYTTEPAKRPITILHLLTHTAGLTYGDGAAEEDYKKAKLHGWYFAEHDETIGEAMDRLATLPLHGHPGEAWQYGFSSDVLGRLVEVVSGQPLDRFFAERIFQPLQMNDTCFYLPPEKAERLAPVYGYEDGKLTKNEPTETTAYIHGPRKCFSGGAGLLSTVQDYGRFLHMLLRNGELDGVRILSPKTVELMHANHTGTKYVRDTTAFGLGFWVLDDLGAYGELGTEGSYGWGSAYYPQYLVDPRERMVAFFMTQLRPTGGLDLNQKFKVLVYQALIDEPRPANEDGTATTSTTNAAAHRATSDRISLIAHGDVWVKVTRAADDTVLFDGRLTRGEIKTMTRKGPVVIAYNPGANLEVEKNGKRFRMTASGLGRSSIP